MPLKENILWQCTHPLTHLRTRIYADITITILTHAEAFLNFEADVYRKKLNLETFSLMVIILLLQCQIVSLEKLLIFRCLHKMTVK